MKKQRKNYSSEEIVAILKKHLLDSVTVSDLCDEYGVHPTMFYRWQKTFFEGGAAAFHKESSREVTRLKSQIDALKGKLARKDNVLAEITEAYVRCKKNDGEY
jgi:transposase